MKRTVGGALALCLVAFPAAPALADPGHDRPGRPAHDRVRSGDPDNGSVSVVRDASVPTVAPHRRGQWLREDAKILAEQTGRSLAEADADLEWQDQVNREIGRLSRAYPDSFAGSRILSHKDRRVWIGFTGEPPRVRLPRGTRAEVVGGRSLDASSLREGARQAAATAEATFGVESTAVPDVVTGEVEVTVAQDPPADARPGVDRVADAARTGDKTPRVEVKFAKGAQSGQEYDITGGARLEFPNSPDLFCSSAFAIRKNGVTSMLTAGHCTPPATHENATDGPEFPITQVQRVYGAQGDLLAYNTSGNEVGQFRTGPNEVRRVTGAPAFGEGTYLCTFGWGGERRTCDTVYRLGVSSGEVGGLVATERHFTVPGDSGGPWFMGGNAYGVHHGWIKIGAYERSLFTPVSRVQSALGASLVVG